jgi:hypothetical protein
MDFSALTKEERRVLRRERVFNGSKYSKAKPGMLKI